MKIPKLITVSVLFALSAITTYGQMATLRWDDLGLADNDPIPTTSSVSTAGVTMTARWTTVTNGGSFVPHGSYGDFLAYRANTQGGHFGWAAMTFNNGNDDPNDKVILTIRFSQTLLSLNFSLTDVDMGTGSSPNWKDAVEVFYNGNNNVKANPGISITRGSGVVNDNETYMDGWEGNANIAPTSSNGNVFLDFGTVGVDSITIIYFSSDDAKSNPDDQQIGVTDFTFNTALLPVEFVHLNALAHDAFNLVEWTTANETNVSFFELEKFNGDVFATIGTIEAEGNSSFNNSYSFIDNNPNEGTNTYRLKVTDIDGTVSYSNTFKVVRNGAIGITVFPTICETNVMVDNISKTNYIAEVYDLQGNLVLQQPCPSSTQSSIAVNNLIRGIYLVRILKNGQLVYDSRIIKE